MGLKCASDDARREVANDEGYGYKEGSDGVPLVCRWCAWVYHGVREGYEVEV